MVVYSEFKFRLFDLSIKVEFKDPGRSALTSPLQGTYSKLEESRLNRPVR